MTSCRRVSITLFSSSQLGDGIVIPVNLVVYCLHPELADNIP